MPTTSLRAATLRFVAAGSLSLFLTLSGGHTARADYLAPFWLTPTNAYTVPTNTWVTLRVLAGGADVRYFWLSNGVPVPGATTNVLTVRASQGTPVPLYSAVATNAYGQITNAYYVVKSQTGTATLWPWGDATRNGRLEVLDLLAIGNHLRTNQLLTGTAATLADANTNGVIEFADQALVHDAILGRINLGRVNDLVIRDGNTNGLADWQDWQLGLSPTLPDSDGDGVNDATELRDGTDPLDPRSLRLYGTYIATPPVSLDYWVPDPNDLGLFVATPPATVFIATPDPNELGLLVATPPTTIFIATPDPNELGLFVATPPASVFIATPDPNELGLFVATPPVTVRIGP